MSHYSYYLQIIYKLLQFIRINTDDVYESRVTMLFSTEKYKINSSNKGMYICNKIIHVF